MTVLMNWNVIHWRGRHVHLVGSAQFKRISIMLIVKVFWDMLEMLIVFINYDNQHNLATLKNTFN